MPNNQKGEFGLKHILVIAGLIMIVGGLFFYFKPSLQEQVSRLQNKRESEEITQEEQEEDFGEEASEEEQMQEGPLTEEHFGEILSALIELPELGIKIETEDSLGGCRMDGRYEGIVQGGRRYAVQESEFVNEPFSLASCQKHSFKETYTETYWIGNRVFNRQYKDKKFEELSAQSKKVTASPPLEELESFVLLDTTGYKKFDSVSISEEDDSWKVEVTLEEKELRKGQLVTDAVLTFIVDGKHEKISKIYTEADIDAFDLKGNLSAETTLDYSPEAITPPFDL